MPQFVIGRRWFIKWWISTGYFHLSICASLGINLSVLFIIWLLYWIFYVYPPPIISLYHASRYFDFLTHWGRVAHICVNNLTIIASDNGVSRSRCQAIIWTSAGIFLIGSIGTNFSEILFEMHSFSFSKMHLKRSSAKMTAILSRPQCVNNNGPGYRIIRFWIISLTSLFRNIMVANRTHGAGAKS